MATTVCSLLLMAGFGLQTFHSPLQRVVSLQGASSSKHLGFSFL